MTTQPNIVFIMTDNHSSWTLGCYGNNDILTPNLDKLAEQGALFTNSFCVNPVCSPNRATVFTGLMPSQHGVHNWLGREEPDAQMGPDAYCTIEEFATLPRLLADAGYRCGLSGKWHLGDSVHPQLGFDYWFSKPGGHTHTFYDAEAIWQGAVYEEPRYSLDAINDHAIEFMRQSASSPFFLYVAYNGPYGLDADMRRGHRNKHTDYYADKALPCFPRGEQQHPWLTMNDDCLDNETAMRSYAAAVSGIDDAVGELMGELDALGLADNTIVVFTADQGLCAGHHGFWGMSDHGRPFTMYEENLRIPLIWRHPARIAAGIRNEASTCNYDFFPSLLEYLGMRDDVPKHPRQPGQSYAPALHGHAVSPQLGVTFHEYENTRTIRTSEWKLTRRHPDGPHDLYDLRNDPGETHNLIDQAISAFMQEELDWQLKTFFDQHADPAYDLWKDGRNKAARL